MFSRIIAATALGCIAFMLAPAGILLGQIPAGRFADIKPVLVDPLYLDYYPTVTEDGLTMIFTNVGYEEFPRRPDSLGSFDLYMATRASTEQPFGNVTNLGLPANTSSSDGFGGISPDGGTLFFGSNRSGGFGIYDLYQATLHNGTFQNVVNLGSGINSVRHENAPSISVDGATIYYHEGANYTEYQRLWSATRSISGAFAETHDLGNALNGDGLTDRRSRVFPSISSDERFLFFEIDEEAGSHIWVSTRPSSDDSFGPPVNINDLWPGTEINSNTAETGVAISPAWPAPGSQIYFARWSAESAYDIYQGTWVPEPTTLAFCVAGILTICGIHRRRCQSLLATEFQLTDQHQHQQDARRVQKP